MDTLLKPSLPWAKCNIHWEKVVPSWWLYLKVSLLNGQVAEGDPGLPGFRTSPFSVNAVNFFGVGKDPVWKRSGYSGSGLCLHSKKKNIFFFRDFPRNLIQSACPHNSPFHSFFGEWRTPLMCLNLLCHGGNRFPSFISLRIVGLIVHSVLFMSQIQEYLPSAHSIKLDTLYTNLVITY